MSTGMLVGFQLGASNTACLTSTALPETAGWEAEGHDVNLRGRHLRIKGGPEYGTSDNDRHE